MKITARWALPALCLMNHEERRSTAKKRNQWNKLRRRKRRKNMKKITVKSVKNGPKMKTKKEKPRTKTRVEYVRTLSAVDMARYISEQYAAGAFEGWKDAANRFVTISVWLSQKVDEFGKAVQDE